MRVVHLSLALAASLVLIDTLQADDKPWTEPARRTQKLNDLIGKEINAETNNEKLGDVDDAIIDMDSGRVIYYIVEVDGRQAAVPAAALKLPDDAARFQLASTKDKLKMHAFDKDKFPNFADEPWAQRVHTEFAVRPYWEDPAKPGATRTVRYTETTVKGGRLTRMTAETWYAPVRRWLKATDVIGKNVENSQNENLGKIEDVVVDPDTGRIIYSVLSFGGFLGMGDKLFAVPFHALTLNAGNDKFILDMDKERLKNAQGFDKNNWPNMADSRWARETHEFYRVRPYWESDDSEPRREQR
ncbi:MAG TPA: PRC-barrel domain-containing protein [Phycisphaerae bacterium]|nr:PRC-barrel domain-containing protein [Phycisphaerae bacterium]